MTTTTDTGIEASVSALEFHEAAWDADERGRVSPDASELSDPALLAIMRYGAADLPATAKAAVRAEATQRGLVMTTVDRWLPVAVLAILAAAGIAVAVMLLLS